MATITAAAVRVGTTAKVLRIVGLLCLGPMASGVTSDGRRRSPTGTVCGITYRVVKYLFRVIRWADSPNACVRVSRSARAPAAGCRSWLGPGGCTAEPILPGPGRPALGVVRAGPGLRAPARAATYQHPCKVGRLGHSLDLQ